MAKPGLVTSKAAREVSNRPAMHLNDSLDHLPESVRDIIAILCCPTGVVNARENIIAKRGQDASNPSPVPA